ncbi:DNA polymerase III subunit psi [Polynucleobacter sp. JS-Safj-400b-B2]|uniref:DNA polymerase III subunit psi n=1 Tax=Polynucleobacter sp. JS-Safj-400b-B2 TaxID=2576921 RepID=UPI001C0BCB48|nr:DNA polymerase III subunit psi [Polynucleobacter sp. JS-Safj-400b-B2]MBU3625778.1 DNA polymerase III subunit psi [Polynucleobacter sp. JS-Safj-400b-B2]
MINNHSAFLKEMGITEWTSRDAVQPPTVVSVTSSNQDSTSGNESTRRPSYGTWWFFGNEPQGDAKILFQNIIRILGLAKDEWSWKGTSENLSQLSSPESPVVVVAFGGPAAQKITGERDSLPQLRETVLALSTGNEEEIPVIASFELNQALANPKEKALLWQDLLLAKSVL